jgi:hypothetical protein
MRPAEIAVERRAIQRLWKEGLELPSGYRAVRVGSDRVAESDGDFDKPLRTP